MNVPTRRLAPMEPLMEGDYAIVGDTAVSISEDPEHGFLADMKGDYMNPEYVRADTLRDLGCEFRRTTPSPLLREEGKQLEVTE